jgi:hypothetical protein
LKSGAKLLLLVLLIVSLSRTSSFSQGGPPLITDDPETPGDGHWEINIATTLMARPDERLWQAPDLDINYGWGERIQLKLDLSWLVLDQRGRGPIGGAGNWIAGVKWRFLDEDKYGVSVSAYPQVEWNIIRSSIRRGLVERGTQYLLPVQIARRVGPVELDLECGYNFFEGSTDEWIYGFAAGWPISDKLELLAELFGVASRSFHTDELTLNFGARQKLTGNATLLMAIGRDVRNAPGEQLQLIGYFGVQLSF